MNFSDQISYNRMFQQVIQKVGDSEINYIKIFQNDKALEISLGNINSEDQMMHTFLENSHQGGKYSNQIASHQPELKREEKIVDQK